MTQPATSKFAYRIVLPQPVLDKLADRAQGFSPLLRVPSSVISPGDLLERYTQLCFVKRYVGSAGKATTLGGQFGFLAKTAAAPFSSLLLPNPITLVPGIGAEGKGAGSAGAGGGSAGPRKRRRHSKDDDDDGAFALAAPLS